MLNKEKYAEEIVEIACSGKHIAIISGMPAVCVGTMCGECDFLGKPCNEKIKEWANSEYVEPSVDWSKVPVDTPILVRDIESDEWERRYFAKYENNTVYAWEDGATSWSAVGVCDWEYAKIAESEGANVHECD